MNKTMKWITMGALSMITCTAFLACTPSDLDAAKAKMEEAGYEVQILEKDDVYLPNEGMVGVIIAKKDVTDEDGNEQDEMLEATLFESKDAAKAYYESYLKVVGEKTNLTQEGKWVYVGTDGAVEIFA